MFVMWAAISKMEPKWSKKYRWHIPDDWDQETWDCCLVFYPDSPQWKSIIRGTLEHLTRGRSWDETTGSITAVQEVARLIPLTFDPTPETREIPGVNEVMACFDEVVVQLTRIADALEESSGQIDYTEQLDSLPALVDIALPLLIEALEPEVAIAAKALIALAEITGHEGALPGLPE